MNTQKNAYKKLSKPQLIPMVLSRRVETKATIECLRDEANEMNTNFKKLSQIISQHSRR